MGKLGYSGKLIAEFMRFAKENKVYWIVPLVVVLLVAMAVVVAGQTSSPFVYTLF